MDTAVKALKQGAYDYLTKPVDPDELSHTVEKAMEHRRARQRTSSFASAWRRSSPPRT